MRQIRGQAEKWKIDPHRIAAMGFSAGGHLLTTLLNRPEDGEVPGADTRWRVSPRPDLAVVCYPVISMLTKPHANSLKNLLGEAAGEELLRKTSSELQARAGLPPIFLWPPKRTNWYPPSTRFFTPPRCANTASRTNSTFTNREDMARG
jgi:acetyl esterase/lipase